MDRQALIDKREKLFFTESRLYSPEDFPGSIGWREHHAALDALIEFDAEHPEILAELKAARIAHSAEVAKNAGWV